MAEPENATQRLKDLLVGFDRTEAFLSVSVVALAVASGVATYMGALRLVSGRPWVAWCFTFGIQGASLATAHLLSSPSVHRRSRVVVFVAWLAATWFSVLTSSLGILELQRDAIEGDNAHSSMQEQWNAAGDELRNFYTSARSWITDEILTNQAALRREHNQELTARARKEPYSHQERNNLLAGGATLTQLQKQLDAPLLIGSAAPQSLNEARETLDQAFNQAASMYATLPPGFRGAHDLPLPPRVQVQSEDSQAVLIRELQAGSVRGWVIVGIALVLDLLPVLLRAAVKRRRPAPQWIRDAKLGTRELVSAAWESRPVHVEHLRVLIEPYNIFGTVSLGSETRMIYPGDLTAAFEQFEKSISQELGKPVSIVSVMSSGGAEVVPELPLLSQLEGDLIRLKVSDREEAPKA
jgi:hypothetical protein